MTVCCKFLDTSFCWIVDSTRVLHTYTRRERERDREKQRGSERDRHTNKCAHTDETKHACRGCVLCLVCSREFIFIYCFLFFPCLRFFLFFYNIFFVVDVYCTNRTKELRCERKHMQTFTHTFFFWVFFWCFYSCCWSFFFVEKINFIPCMYSFFIRIFLSLWVYEFSSTCLWNYDLYTSVWCFFSIHLVYQLQMFWKKRVNRANLLWQWNSLQILDEKLTKKRLSFFSVCFCFTVKTVIL